MQKIGIEYLKSGMVTKVAVHSADGQVVVAAGAQLTDAVIQKLRQLGIEAIYVDSPHMTDMEIPQTVREDLRVQAIQTVQQCFENLQLSHVINSRQFADMSKQLVEEVLRNRETVIHMADIRTHDEYIFGHSVNVCVLSVLIGAALGYDKNKLRELALGALLHDIGKMLVPASILNKKGLYTNSELERMRQHPAKGFELLRNLGKQDLSLFVAHVAYQHHERIDGSGYPRGLKGNEIHEYARIVAIADVYDAMVSGSSYRRSLMPREAYEVMMSYKNTHFDAELLDLFFKTVAIYPLGSVVELSNGEIGIIVKVNPELFARPTIKMIADDKGNLVRGNQEVDLTKNMTMFVRKVLRDEEIFHAGLLNVVCRNFAEGMQEKEYLQDTFGRYVTRDLANVVLEKGVQMSSRFRIATVMFTDIENYTTMVERLNAEEVVELLNEYFTKIVEIIMGHKGNVNKFIGDSVMALFNIYSDDPEHAQNAVRAALQIQKMTHQTMFGRKKLLLKTRAGINTGNVVAGNIGSRERTEYTVIGDTVNIASRLEQLNKEYGSHIIVGQDTYDIIKDQFLCEGVGAVHLKGKKQLIRGYRVMA